MPFLESDGDNDFASIFDNYRSRKRDIEEKRRAQEMLRLLEGLEGRDEYPVDRDPLDRNPGDNPLDRFRDRPGTQHCCCHECERKKRKWQEEEVRRREAQQNRFPGAPRWPRKEYMRVSITDDERSQERERKRRLEERQKKVGRVHTIDDLPPDTLDMYFSSPVIEEPDPPFFVESGRRLGDGEVMTQARLSPWMSDLVEDLWPVRWELLFLVIFVVLAFVFLRRRRRPARAAAPGALNRDVEALKECVSKQQLMLARLLQQKQPTGEPPQEQQQQQNQKIMVVKQSQLPDSLQKLLVQA